MCDRSTGVLDLARLACISGGKPQAKAGPGVHFSAKLLLKLWRLQRWAGLGWLGCAVLCWDGWEGAGLAVLCFAGTGWASAVLRSAVLGRLGWLPVWAGMGWAGWLGCAGLAGASFVCVCVCG